MKKLFFLLLTLNVLVYLGMARYGEQWFAHTQPAAVEVERQDPRALNSGQEAAGMPEGEAVGTAPPAQAEDVIAVVADNDGPVQAPEPSQTPPATADDDSEAGDSREVNDGNRPGEAAPQPEPAVEAQAAAEANQTLSETNQAAPETQTVAESAQPAEANAVAETADGGNEAGAASLPVPPQPEDAGDAAPEAAAATSAASQAAAAEADSDTAAQAAPASPAPAPSAAEACFTSGPFASEQAAEQVMALLAELQIKPDLRTTEVLDIKDYRVMVPTAGRAEAVTVLQGIRQSGDQDVALITRGENKDKVSVGVFNQRSNAETRKAQIERLGFATEVVPRGDARTLWWVDWLADPVALSVQDINDRARAAGMALDVESRDCGDPGL